MSNHPVIYGIEIGGTNSRGGAYINGETQLISTVRTPQNPTRPESNPQALLEMVQALVNDIKQQAPSPDALGVSITGMLRITDAPGVRDYGPLANRELQLSSPNISGLTNFPFLSWLESGDWGVPIHVENDANVALRSAEEYPTAICINMGTGIGAAVKQDNRIVHMPGSWSCYEIGHGLRWMLPDKLMRKCQCGTTGCLEAAIGARALTERYGVRPEEAPEDVYNKMREEVVEYLAPAISDTSAKFDIPTVILSGRSAFGYNQGFDFVGALKEKMKQTRPAQPIPEMHLVKFGEAAGLHGVALSVLDNGIVNV